LKAPTDLGGSTIDRDDRDGGQCVNEHIHGVSTADRAETCSPARLQIRDLVLEGLCVRNRTTSEVWDGRKQVVALGATGLTTGHFVPCTQNQSGTTSTHTSARPKPLQPARCPRTPGRT
jgi:hypothetical protein